MAIENNLIKKQIELDEYWKDRLSDERLGKMIDVERRWAEWLSIKRDAILEYGFSKKEAIKIICSILSKLEFHQNLIAQQSNDDNS